MEKLRVQSLFAGIGGFELGLERAGGFETVSQCEIDPFAQAVLAKHWPNSTRHSDVTTYDFKEGEADVITAGFPCQDISFAGDGAGLAGARSGLYREVVRAVRVVRPLYAVLENVAALLGRGLDTVLGDLAEVGYDAEWHCIPASAVGAPHRRDRIWIIADAGGEQHEGCRAPISGALATELSWANSDATSEQWNRAGFGTEVTGRRESSDVGENVAHSECVGQPGQGQPFITSHPEADSKGQAGDAVYGGVGNQWAVEPDVGRVAHGIPSRVDRLRCLGNAVVPQIPEIIGRAILESRRAAA